MQLSSLVLSATALLAGAASGYLLFSEHPGLVDIGAAQIGPDPSRAPVGFYMSQGTLDAAEIHMSKRELLPPFVLRETKQGEWLLTADGGPPNVCFPVLPLRFQRSYKNANHLS